MHPYARHSLPLSSFYQLHTPLKIGIYLSRNRYIPPDGNLYTFLPIGMYLLPPALGAIPFAYINLFLYLCTVVRSTLCAFITKNEVD